MRLPRMILAALLLVPLAAACSSSPTAQAQVCDASAALTSAFQQVQSDISAGKFGDAKHHLAAVRSAMDQLSAAQRGLSAGKEAQIQVHLAEAKSALDALDRAADLPALGSVISHAASALRDLESAARSAANCPS